MSLATARIESPRAFLRSLFREAVAAAHPAACLAANLPPPPRGRLFVLAAGKAAAAMTEIAERHYLDQTAFDPARLFGLATTRHGHARPTRRVPVIEAGHPIPDETGLKAADKTLALARQAGPDDLVLVLLSGGASANWIAPAPPVSLADKQTVTRALLRSGASIAEINTLRKHLSRIKGGRLAAAAAPARVVTLAISDVPGDDPAVIGSGPSVADPSTLADARAIAARYRLDLPASVTQALADAANETPKPGDHSFANSEFHIVARPADAFRAAAAKVREAGLECVDLGESIEGEARTVAEAHARLARELQSQKRRAVILSGGELTVTVRGRGRGGPNQEYALALAIAFDGVQGLAALAADTDGADGGSGGADDPAGAFTDGTSAARARALGLDPASFLTENDATSFFSKLHDLLLTGPTYTNINDFRAILVDSP